MAAGVRLRPVTEHDLPRLTPLLIDPDSCGEWEWFGFRLDRVRHIERQWQQDGLIGDEHSYLAVRTGDELAGWVTWSPAPSMGSAEIGIALFTEYRGRGVGTTAQQLLVGYLFAHTTVHRIEARTEASNFAEQRALEKSGFHREGVMRGVTFRSGIWRDCVLYGVIREDIHSGSELQRRTCR